MAYDKINEFLKPEEVKRIEELDHNITIFSLELTDLRKQRRRIMAKARCRRNYRRDYGLGSNKPKEQIS